jgi:hypothetical protein
MESATRGYADMARRQERSIVGSYGPAAVSVPFGQFFSFRPPSSWFTAVLLVRSQALLLLLLLVLQGGAVRRTAVRLAKMRLGHNEQQREAAGPRG